MNPADVATRPNISAESAQRWLIGPDFLYSDPMYWPRNTQKDNELDTHIQVVAGREDPSETEPQEYTIDSSEQQIETHSQINENIPQTVQRTAVIESMEVDKNHLTSDYSLTNISNNHIDQIRQVQKECFSKELTGMKTDLVRALDVYKDEDGILRCRGRLQNTDWSHSQKHPILLPKDHAFTSKIIEDAHRRNYHVGVSHTLAIIRKQYWIPRGRMQVQKLLRQCPACKKYSGGPYRLPPMAPLPPERVTYSEPFSYVGLDYFGPVLVDKNGCLEKRWISLYTCLAVRAIHMELVKDLTAEECLLGLRRFVSSRGVPKLIISDNALQFKLAADVLTGDYCVTNRIKWRFIPELAPWFGGFYERLIGIVKNCLKKTVDKHMLNHSQLGTIIKEIEAVVNSRPLTVVGEELEHVLTPADFLRTGGPSILVTSDKEFLESATITKSNLVEGWKRGQHILREYID
ncbi:uncharacterized protein LOC131849969 [Achroia grisella]|uniref:uncharacterized protein LOC131849969 n=1 Tax=Achroia grisella TaxID=688607 RepID=UPI0027D3486D|nr:uncharacterized protein LOC131849969 [Achroia grisella]